MQKNMKMHRLDKFRVGGYGLATMAVYFFMAYMIGRSDFYFLIGAIVVLFILYFLLVNETLSSARYIRWGIGLAMAFRLVLLFAIPNLSDDFYRFIWDGNLFVHGINPFAHTPEFYMQSGAPPAFLSADLFEGLNSSGYYTVYPPVCQYISGAGAALFGDQLAGNIVMIRLFILASEAGTIWILKKLLDRFNLNPMYVLIYALNPLIILELAGNLHFEAIMIFFVLLMFYLLLERRYMLASVCFMLAVNTKLIPLLLAPYIAFSLGWKRAAYFMGILAGGTLVLHAPFIDAGFIANFFSSLGLYFKSFEFNASIYYIVRWLGFQVEGYNIIQTAGPLLAVISTCLIVGICWKYRDGDQKWRNLPVVYLFVLTIYYLFSTTVHPWYVSSMIAFVPMAGMVYPLAWSAVIPLTYAAYMTSAYTENLWLVALEYTVVAVVMILEWQYRDWTLPQKLSNVFGVGGYGMTS